MAAKIAKATDRRVVRTDERLGQALIALVRDRGFQKITARDVTRRAGVGRSTFYTHFGDVDELHGHTLREFLRRRRGKDTIFGFTGAFFAHAAERGRSWIGQPGTRRGTAARAQLRKAVLTLVREEIKARRPNLSPAIGEAIARYVAGAFADVLFWWIDTPNGLSAAEIELVFRRLTAGALESVGVVQTKAAQA